MSVSISWPDDYEPTALELEVAAEIMDACYADAQARSRLRNGYVIIDHEDEP